MKEFRYTLKNELWKALHNRMFLIALLVGAVFIIWDMVLTWIDVDVFNQNLSWMLSNPEMAASVGMRGDPEGYAIFNEAFPYMPIHIPNLQYRTLWPVLAALPYGWSYLQDRRDGIYNQISCRAGRKGYFAAKYLAVFVSGGLATVFPLAGDVLAVAVIAPYYVPNVTTIIYTITNGNFLSRLFYSAPWLHFAGVCGAFFLLGGATACLCFLLGTKVKLEIMVVLFPVAVYQVLDTAITLLLAPAMNAKLGYILTISPQGIMMPSNSFPNPEWLVFLEIGLLTAVSFFGGYRQVVGHELA